MNNGYRAIMYARRAMDAFDISDMETCEFNASLALRNFRIAFKDAEFMSDNDTVAILNNAAAMASLAHDDIAIGNILMCKAYVERPNINN